MTDSSPLRVAFAGTPQFAVPALAALLLRPKAAGAASASGWLGAVARVAHAFNGGFDGLSQRYGRYTALLNQGRRMQGSLRFSF